MCRSQEVPSDRDPTASIPICVLVQFSGRVIAFDQPGSITAAHADLGPARAAIGFGSFPPPTSEARRSPRIVSTWHAEM